MRDVWSVRCEMGRAMLHRQCIKQYKLTLYCLFELKHN